MARATAWTSAVAWTRRRCSPEPIPCLQGVGSEPAMFFVFPQAWIAPAVLAAALHFGPIRGEPKITYQHLSGNSIGLAVPPNHIVIDKRPRSYWTRDLAQCVIIHEYGHLRGRKHSRNYYAIMNKRLHPSTCSLWLRRHGL